VAFQTDRQTSGLNVITVKTTVIIVGRDSDTSLTQAARGLSQTFDRVETVPIAGLAEELKGCADGNDQIIIIPYLLELDDRVRDMLENTVDQARKSSPGSQILLGPQVGYDPRLLEILEDRVNAARNESSLSQKVPIITVSRQGGKSVAFSVGDLEKLPDQLDDIGKIVPDRQGEAVSVSALLNAAEFGDASGKITFNSGSNFTADVSIDVARDKGWLVYRLDRSTLPTRFGGPVRLFIPGIDDQCANVKSVDQIIVE
jgi:hypothetical protein